MKPDEAMDIVRQTMDRVSKLKKFRVTVSKPPVDWELKFPCPFDVKAKADGKQFECIVLALTLQEAKKIVAEHYGI